MGFSMKSSYDLLLLSRIFSFHLQHTFLLSQANNSKFPGESLGRLKECHSQPWSVTWSISCFNFLVLKLEWKKIITLLLTNCPFEGGTACWMLRAWSSSEPPKGATRMSITGLSHCAALWAWVRKRSALRKEKLHAQCPNKWEGQWSPQRKHLTTPLLWPLFLKEIIRKMLSYPTPQTHTFSALKLQFLVPLGT